MDETERDALTGTMASVAIELNLRPGFSGASYVENDRAGDYITFEYAGKEWCASFGENGSPTGDPERDCWGGNTDGDRFLEFATPIRGTCTDAWLIAEGIARCIGTAHP